MRLRTFTAIDMPAAMKLVRKELGSHAVILTSELLKNGKGITVTAAKEESDEWQEVSDKRQVASGKKKESSSLTTHHSPLATDSLRFELQNLLRFHNVPELFVAKLMQKASDKELGSIHALHRISAQRDEKLMLRPALEKLLGGFFGFEPLYFSSPIRGEAGRGAQATQRQTLEQASPHPNPPPNGEGIILIGPPGVGKTLAIAKMAARLTMDKQPVAVITTDTKRAGGVEQLQAFTNILGLGLQVADTPRELEKALNLLPRSMQILVDTAGCNPFDRSDVTELAELASIPGIEPVLVLPAGGDSLEAIDMVENLSQIPARRLLITRTDTSRRFGGALAAAMANTLAFCNAGGSASTIDSLQPMTAALLAQLLLRYKIA